MLPYRLLMAIALAFMAVAASQQMAAAAPSLEQLHTVSGIDVDVTADTAAAAREQAIVTAQRRAFSVLVQRLTLLSPGEVPDIEQRELAGLVNDFEIAGEKSSAVRYLGTFTVRFRPEAMRRYMRQSGVGFTEAFRPPSLVLPVLIGPDRARLWDAPNPWLNIWQAAPKQSGLLTLAVPSGGLEDMVAGNVDQVLSGSLESLDALRQRHGTESVFVVAARIVPATDTTPLRLAMESREYGLSARPDGPREGERLFGYIDSTQITLVADTGESETSLLTRGREAMIARLNQNWKSRTVVALSTERGNIVVAVGVHTIADWQLVQRKLAAESAITRITVLSLSRDRARLALEHLGSTGELRQLLSQHGLNLSAEPLSLDPSLEGDLRRTSPKLVDDAAPAPANGIPPVLVAEPTFLLTIAGSGQ